MLTYFKMRVVIYVELESLSFTDDDLVRCRTDLAYFSEYCFGLYNKWFHEAWYDTIRNPAVRSGLIIAPRNSAKSTCWAKIAPIWLLGNNSDLRIVLVSRTSTLAQTNLAFIRMNIESNDKLREVFPSREIGGRVYGLKQAMPWGSEQLTVKNNRMDGAPSIYAVGLEGSITGIRADLIIVDDLIDQNNVMTDSQRDKVNAFWDTVVIPTLNPDGRIFCVGTRYHAKDFYTRLLEDSMYKDHTFMFPAMELDERGELKLGEGGQPISYWPERWSVEELLKIKERMGSLAFNCLTEDNKIWTKTGLKEVKSVKCGDHVLTHLGNWEKVEVTHRKLADEPIHSLQIYGDPEPIKVTASHKIWSFKTRRYKSKRLAPWNKGISQFVDNYINENLGWHEAKELDNGDFIITPIDETITETEYNDEDFWWLVGLYLAEGCLNHSNHRIVFTLASHETDLSERILKTVEKYGSKASIRMKETSMNVDFSNEKIYQFLKPFGHLAHNKHLTWESLHLPKILQKSMWEGYLAGDGFIQITPYNNKRAIVTSVSLDVLRGFKMILLRLGKVGYIAKLYDEKHCIIRGRKVNQHTAYRISVNLESKRRKPADIYNGFLYSRIRHKKIKDTNETVYDIQVANDHSFTVSQGSISNSQFMCDPSGYAGQLFDPEWLQYYDPIRDLMPVWGNLDFVMSVDPNITEDPESDNTAIVTAAVDRKNATIYVLDIFAKPIGFLEQVKEIQHYGRRLQVSVGTHKYETEIHISKIGIEATAYQRSLQQTGYMMWLPVTEIKQHNRTKEIRILGLGPHFESGRLRFPDPSVMKTSWWDGFYEEYCTFPKGRRDDRLDALEILTTMVSESFGVSGIPWGPGGEVYGNRNIYRGEGGFFVR